MVRRVKPSLEEIYFRRYLKVTPLSLALQRAIEAKYLKSVALKPPVLDLGCGFGEFARVFFQKPIAIGLDIDPQELKEARKTRKYKRLVQADARKMPFENNYFETIISVSSLEHVVRVDQVLKEVNRVLKPGGVFALTLDTIDWEENLCFGPFFKKIGLKKIGEGYLDLFNRVFKHQPLLSQKEWEARIKKAGFKIKISKMVADRKIPFLFDLFLIFAWPAQLAKKISGRRLVWRPKFMVNWLTKLFLKDIEREKGQGTNLFLVAQKSR